MIIHVKPGKNKKPIFTKKRQWVYRQSRKIKRNYQAADRDFLELSFWETF